MAADNEFPGMQAPNTQSIELNATQFMIDQALSRISTAKVVKIVKVTSTGTVGPIGQVSVQPMVKMQNSGGKLIAHGQLHSLPYFRLQGGAKKCIIMDPDVDDIGLAIFADRDISAVKANKAESQPGSFRQFDMADGLYLGSFMSKENPDCYIRFTQDNKIICSVGATDPFQYVVADDHVQMKQFNHTDMHITINKLTGLITSGKAIGIAPDPFPAD